MPLSRPTFRLTPLAFTLALLSLQTLAHAEVAPPSSTEVDALRVQLEAQVKSLADQQKRLDEELKKVQAAQQRLESMQNAASATREVELGGDRVSRSEQSLFRGGESDTKLDVATVFAQPSILTPPGQFVFEPSLQYSFSSSDRVSIIGYSVLNAVLIGLIDVRTVNRSNWTLGLGGRYGLTNRLEIEARLPFVYRTDDTLTRPIEIEGGSATDQRFSAEGADIGDFEVGLRYQLNVPQADSPFYIAGVRIKSVTGTGPYDVTYVNDQIRGTFPRELPTGTGFYSVQGSLSAVLPADPAVFFGGINYLWNKKESVNRFIVPQTQVPNSDPPEFEGGVFIGEVDPGDSIGLNFGMGVALNERSSFSIGYEHTWIDKTKQDGETADNSISAQLGALQVGFSYRLNKQSSLNLSIGAGVTEDAPDATISLRLPYRF